MEHRTEVRDPETGKLAERCDCFSRVGKEVEARVREQMPEGATEMTTSWEGGCLILSGADNPPISLAVNAEYREVKKNGEPHKRRTTKQIRILPTFCPFCGRKYAK